MTPEVPPVESLTGLRRERLRFVGFSFDRLPSGRCRAEVTLELGPGERWVGTAEGVASDTGELRCAAEATLRAIEQSVRQRVAFELLGVKAVRAFDTIVLIVSVVSKGDDTTHRLVGSFLANHDTARGAAVAVLNATNRLLGNMFRREVA
ncbi:MAG: hypothetical protein OER21_03165 [Gemmatimonadota bacterium]|nr:hypothetical protein [Gemmatimonadota bacterium]